jgi:hypothetical protein
MFEYRSFAELPETPPTAQLHYVPSQRRYYATGSHGTPDFIPTLENTDRGENLSYLLPANDLLILFKLAIRKKDTKIV